jgi:hypothetical protein
MILAAKGSLMETNMRQLFTKTSHKIGTAKVGTKFCPCGLHFAKIEQEKQEMISLKT